MSSRPDKVKVGYQTFTIKWHSNESWKAAGLRLDDGGQSWWGTGEIHIRLGAHKGVIFPECVIKETLVHEIMHMVYEAANLTTGKQPKDNEEWLIRRLSYPLFEVFQENPDVVEYLSTVD